MSYAHFTNQYHIATAMEREEEMKWFNVNAALSGTIRNASTSQTTWPRKGLSAATAKCSMSSKRKQWSKFVGEELTAMSLR